ncbi:hypothetical protein PoB_007534800 [Plakobranchus ocellatus]|uniref:Uncharacterized protein n=1 Tax=Plakobranchus ocellatus TaxID=259542 RepID=A0AAV4DX53_9GAST|nr:hypothetical protein PoB_007534800 [Plakobranchus ocellatus]
MSRSPGHRRPAGLLNVTRRFTFQAGSCSRSALFCSPQNFSACPHTLSACDARASVYEYSTCISQHSQVIKILELASEQNFTSLNLRHLAFKNQQKKEHNSLTCNLL